MPKSQALQRKAPGLFGQYNPLHEAPEGALLEAQNVVASREGVISKRRGFGRYGASLSAGGAESFLDFKNRVVVLDGQTLKYDSDGAGTWVAWSGTYRRPDDNHRIRGVEARSNLYFTSRDGVWKQATLTGTPVGAGVPQGLDLELTKVALAGGWFTPDAQVAYTVIWGRTDANDFLILGAPSERESLANAVTLVTLAATGTTVTVTHTAHGCMTGDEVTLSEVSNEAFEDGPHVIMVTGLNTYQYTTVGSPPATGTARAGKAVTVNMVFTVPPGVALGDFYEIYRSQLSGSNGSPAADEYFKVERLDITAAQITAGTVSYSDTADEAFLGLRLYTSASRETRSKENRRPPWARDIALFRGHVFYSATRQEHQLELRLKDLTGLVVGDTVRLSTGAAYTYTFRAVENIGLNEVLLSTAQPTAAQNIEATAKSLVRVINRGTVDLVAYYVSGTDDPPGKMLVRSTGYDGTSFTVLGSSATVGARFEPNITMPATSTNDDTPNRLYRSKFEQPEAVPSLNFEDLGSEESPVLRILALRDSLIVLKEDGVWRVTGDQERDFSYRQLDPSVRLLANETAVVLNNAVFCLANQGVVRIDENGTAIVSRPIEFDLKDVFNYTGWEMKSHAVAYERERLYLLFTQGSGSDNHATQAWVYNYLTPAWTKYLKPATAAMVLFDSETLYLAHGVDNYVLEERRSGTRTSVVEFRDESIPVTVTAVTTTLDADGNTVSRITVTYTYSGWVLAAGGLFEYQGTASKITAVTALGGSSYRIDLEDLLSVVLTSPAGLGGFAGLLGFMGLAVNDGTISAGGGTVEATIALPIESRIRWVPEDLQNPGVSKQFTFLQLYFEDDLAFTHRVGFRTDANATETFVDDLKVARVLGWGQNPWGDAPWGDDALRRSTPIRTVIPRTHQRCRAISVVHEHKIAAERFALINLALTARQIGERTTRVPA